MCKMLYNIHTESPIINKAGERQILVLNTDYSKVNIPSMVADLNITAKLKVKFQGIPEKFPTLFGIWLEKLTKCKPSKIKLKKGSKPYTRRYCNLSKAYVKPSKKEVEQMVKYVEYLGNQLTSKGIKPQPKNIELMQQMQPPRNVKELKRFIGMINFYCEKFEKQSHVLAPLNKLAGECSKIKGESKIDWYMNDTHQESFKKVK